MYLLSEPPGLSSSNLTAAPPLVSHSDSELLPWWRLILTRRRHRHVYCYRLPFLSLDRFPLFAVRLHLKPFAHVYSIDIQQSLSLQAVVVQLFVTKDIFISLTVFQVYWECTVSLFRKNKCCVKSIINQSISSSLESISQFQESAPWSISSFQEGISSFYKS